MSAPKGMKPLGRGAYYRVQGHTLTIVADLSKQVLADAPPSSTGKSKLPINSGGYVGLPEIEGFRIMLQGQVGYQGVAPTQNAGTGAAA